MMKLILNDGELRTCCGRRVRLNHFGTNRVRSTNLLVIQLSFQSSIEKKSDFTLYVVFFNFSVRSLRGRNVFVEEELNSRISWGEVFIYNNLLCVSMESRKVMLICAFSYGFVWYWTITVSSIITQINNILPLLHFCKKLEFGIRRKLIFFIISVAYESDFRSNYFHIQCKEQKSGPTKVHTFSTGQR